MSEQKYTAMQYAQMQGGHSVDEDKKGLEFMQTLGEARMFRSREQIAREGARSLTDHLFVSLLSLYAMSNDYEHAPVAKEYARRTMTLGNFNNPSPGGTDVYQTIFSALRPEMVGKKEKDQMLIDKVHIDQIKIKRFLNGIKSGNVDPGQAKSFFYKLERDLKIQDPKLRAARRHTQDWNTLSTQQRQLVGTQLSRYFRINARRSDLFPLFSSFAKHNNLEISDKKKSSIKGAIIATAAGAAAGYALGKSVKL